MKEIEILFVDTNKEQRKLLYEWLDENNRPFKVKGRLSKRRIIFKTTAEERWKGIASVGVEWWQA